MSFVLRPKVWGGERVDKCLLVGFDVGKIRDPSAVCVTVAERKKDVAGQPIHYYVRLAKRLELGMPYPQQVAEVLRIFEGAAKKYNEQYGGGLKALVVDTTGVGEAVFDLLSEGLKRIDPHAFSYSCKFVGGGEVNQGEGRNRHRVSVGKDAFVSKLQVLIESQQIHVPTNLSIAEILREELLDFDIDIDETSGKATYGAIRQGTHDDLVCALGLCVLPEIPTGIDLSGARFTTGIGPRYPNRGDSGYGNEWRDWFAEAARTHGH